MSKKNELWTNILGLKQPGLLVHCCFDNAQLRENTIVHGTFVPNNSHFSTKSWIWVPRFTINVKEK